MIWKQRMQCCLQAVISMSVHVPSNNREVPLKIHSLSRLAERTGLDKQLSEEQLDFIDKLEPLNIEARYPSYKERLMKSLTKEYCAELLSQTKELQLWIKNKL